MKFMRKRIFLSRAICISLLLLSACATTVPPEALKDVDQEISFKKLQENPEAYEGKTAVFGGTIISVENSPESTLLMVLQHDLDANREPLQNDQSKGRFIAVVPEFLDPAIYGKGRRITIVGTASGKEIRPLNEISYVYPVIKKSALFLWPVQNIYDSRPRVYFGIGVGGIGF